MAYLKELALCIAFKNGALQGVLWHDKDNWTMYVSPYMVSAPTDSRSTTTLVASA